MDKLGLCLTGGIRLGMEKVILNKVLVGYSKALLPSNEASKLIYCAKKYIGIRELAVSTFFYVCPCLPIFVPGCPCLFILY